MATGVWRAKCAPSNGTGNMTASVLRRQRREKETTIVEKMLEGKVSIRSELLEIWEKPGALSQDGYLKMAGGFSIAPGMVHYVEVSSPVC